MKTEWFLGLVLSTHRSIWNTVIMARAVIVGRMAFEGIAVKLI